MLHVLPNVKSGEVQARILISKTVLPSVNSSPPPHTVDSTVFEMWLGSLSAHQGLAIPVA